MSTTGHTSRAKDLAIVREAQKPIEFISKVLGWIATSIAILAIVLLVRGCVSEHAEKKAKVTREAAAYATTHPAPSATHSVEALVPTATCWTPCSAFVGWSYKVRTDGDPFRVKYYGCDWVSRPGKGDFSAPKEFQPGETQFVSGDDTHPSVRIQVYKKVMCN